MLYEHHSVLLASMHEKERAIARPFFEHLSCTLAIHDFNTDQFGTFTGEIERRLSPYETGLLKAETAAAQYGYRLAVASEGSFGPHPLIPFVASAQEWMVFIDREPGLVIAEQVISQKTNYAMMTIQKTTDITAFLKRTGFPSHALTLQAGSDKGVLAKGIRDWDCLHASLELGFQNENELLLGTDMRAMMNPTRMEVLGELADKLAQRIATLCPECRIPGFGFKTTQGSLPCRLCEASTSFYKHEVWACVRCDYQELKERNDGLLEAEPTYCDYCNP
ncbi:DUF6671 family protein [Legionella taurinensis]|uniref:DUF6671 domain-containing protein n=1 Tax=Legionella taurinensis TaxID=70611 RepID=A0A3A5L4B4_9GAMM|nr:DUF6671 family protein [Legionella taurinensis]RJT47339.1 hypothetical protein D6J04_07155 [Legionella taurinensis]RJT68614.1 hypothetical protein D6J03_04065 [Legionella taurinensis]STY24672.1 Uncharacterised protein [Legionella taurinensis]